MSRSRIPSSDSPVFNPPQGCRIVLTGGPGGGKTTAADLLRRELGEEVTLVPEAATLLFSGGFPRYPNNSDSIGAVQRAIFAVQRSLEETLLIHCPGRILLCDRGTIDGAAYWPGDDTDAFFSNLGTTFENELSRYDAVIFFESAAVGGLSISSGNRARVEGLDEAVALDRRLHALWSQHPNFTFIPHNASFFKKITFALAAFEGIVAQLRRHLYTNNNHPNNNTKHSKEE